MTTILMPARTADQRLEALKRANDIRVRRAQLKRQLKKREVRIVDVLTDPPYYAHNMKTHDLLCALPKYGTVKAQRVLIVCRISLSKTVGGLSGRQRAELIRELTGQ